MLRKVGLFAFPALRTLRQQLINLLSQKQKLRCILLRALLLGHLKLLCRILVLKMNSLQLRRSCAVGIRFFATGSQAKKKILVFGGEWKLHTSKLFNLTLIQITTLPFLRRRWVCWIARCSAGVECGTRCNFGQQIQETTRGKNCWR